MLCVLQLFVSVRNSHDRFPPPRQVIGVCQMPRRETFSLVFPLTRYMCSCFPSPARYMYPAARVICTCRSPRLRACTWACNIHASWLGASQKQLQCLSFGAVRAPWDARGTCTLPLGARGTCTLARGVRVPWRAGYMYPSAARGRKKQNRKRVCNFVFCSPGTCMYPALRSSPRRGKSRYGHVPSRRGASTFLRSPPPPRRVHVPSLVFG